MPSYAVARGQVGSSPSGDLGWRPSPHASTTGHSPAAGSDEGPPDYKETFTFSRMLSGDGARLSLPRIHEVTPAQTHTAARESDRHQRSPRPVPTLEHIEEVQEAPVLADDGRVDDE